MHSFGNALFIVLLAVVAYLFLRLAAQRELLSQLKDEQRTLAEAWRAGRVDLSEFTGSKQNPIITIEILNAVELAAKQSKFGGMIGKYAPDMIRKMVIKRTADTMRDQMTGNGVHVEVQVHGLD